MKFSLERKIFIGFTLVIFVLAILGIFSFRNNQRYADTNKLISHTEEVLYHIEQVLSASLDMETGIQGYAIINDTVFLKPYYSGQQKAYKHLAVLKKLVSDNPFQTSKLKQLETAFFQKMTSLYFLKNSMSQKGTLENKLFYESKKQMEDIRLLIAEMKQHESDLLAIRIRNNEKASRIFYSYFVLFFLFILVTLIAVYYIIQYNLKIRARSEQTLKENWNMFQSVLDKTTTAVSIKSLDGKYLLVNKRFEKYIEESAKFSTQEHTKKSNILNNTIREILSEKQADVQEEFDKEALKSPIPIHRETTVNRASGVPITFYVVKFSLTNKQGEPYAICTIGTDISDRKEQENNIQRLNEELSSKVTQLELLNKELESFTYSISHDLRTPLRAIDGYSRILKEDFTKNLNEDGRRVLSIIIQNTHRMGHLIDDMLAFSRIGKLELQRVEVDMKNMTQQIVEEFNSETKTIPGRYYVNIHDMPTVRADHHMMRQVWINLIGNALKYTSKKEFPEIMVGSRVEGEKKVFFVSDNGVGFDMKYAHKLFGVFQRLHVMEEFEGTGVGLAIVHRIIEKHGGSIWVDAEPDKGATFCFFIPDNEMN